MLENVRVKQESSWAGLNLNFQTTIGNHQLRLELPFYVQGSKFSAAVEKAGGKIVFLRRESSPLPPGFPARLIKGKPLARIVHGDNRGIACLEIGSGTHRGEPLRLELGEGLLGDGLTQVTVFGREAFLKTIVVVRDRSTFNLDINPDEGKLYTNIQVFR